MVFFYQPVPNEHYVKKGKHPELNVVKTELNCCLECDLSNCTIAYFVTPEG